MAQLRQLRFEQAEALYSPELLEAADKPISDFPVIDNQVEGLNELNAGIFLDIKLRLARFVLFMQDRLSMAAGVEARVPFLDHEFVEYVAGLSPDMKLRPPWGKFILRLSAKKLLPEAILMRPKQGFVEPADSWMRGKLPECIMDALSEVEIKRKGYFQPAEVVRLLEEHRGEKADHGHLLIGIASTQIWHDIFFAGGPPKRPEY